MIGVNIRTYTSYKEKYDNFVAPKYVLKIGGSEIQPSEFHIVDITVLSSAGFDIGSCEIQIASRFQVKDGEFAGQFGDKYFEKFTPGKTVDVLMGYQKPQGVFKGYINSLSFEYRNQEEGIVTIQCLDGKGALVNSKEWKNFGKKKLSAIVQEIVKSKCATYFSKSTIEVDFDKEKQSKPYNTLEEKKTDIDDYQYLIEYAKKTNSSFCFIYDEFFFCKNLSQKRRATIDLEWGQNMQDMQVEINLSDQVGKVVVYGDDPITQTGFAVKEPPTSGSGKSGADLSSVVKKKVLTISDASLINQNQGKSLAQSVMQGQMSKLCSCKCKIVGIPDVLAGGKVQLSNVGKGVDGIYYLTHVTHKFSDEVYTTTFTGTRARIS